MSIKTTITVLLILVFGHRFIMAEEIQYDDKPDYQEMMLRNLLLPGLAQHDLGNDKEARFFYAALPLSAIGMGMTIAGFAGFTDGVSLELERIDGQTYLFKYAEEPPSEARLLLLGGTILSLYGNLLATYSNYAAHRDFVDTYGHPSGALPVRTGRDGLLDLMLAPFRPRSLLNADVLPVLGLMTMSYLAVEDFQTIINFFRRDTVPFLGFEVPPAAGIGLQLATSLLFVTANACWEEIAYRGLSLETAGKAFSSLSFGLAHLGNLLMPGVSVEGTLLQTLFATAFGFYAADVAERQRYRLERVVTLHFWNNVASMVLGYLSNPEENQVFQIGISLIF